MGAFDGELAALGHRTSAGNNRTSVTRKRVTPVVGMRVRYGCGKEGTAMYVSDTLVVVRWDSPQKSKWGGWTIQEEAVPSHHYFYECKEPSHDD